MRESEDRWLFDVRVAASAHCSLKEPHSGERRMYDILSVRVPFAREPRVCADRGAFILKLIFVRLVTNMYSCTSNINTISLFGPRAGTVATIIIKHNDSRIPKR